LRSPDLDPLVDAADLDERCSTIPCRVVIASALATRRWRVLQGECDVITLTSLSARRVIAITASTYGNETSVVRTRSGNRLHEEMDRRAIACFDRALEDVGSRQSRSGRCCTTTSCGPPRRPCRATTTLPTMSRKVWSFPDGPGMGCSAEPGKWLT